MTVYRIENGLIPQEVPYGAEMWYYVVEIPASLCLDTIILPISLTNELLISGGNKNSESQDIK